MTDIPFANDTRLRPLTAIRAVRALLANGEDTSQIFVIFRALRGKSGIKTFQSFKASPTGEAVLRERRSLLAALENRQALAALPAGSVGRVYFDFMEAENLSANGLVQASESWEKDPVPPDVSLFRERMRDAHDLTHILTGYGRDPLGELCLLAYMYRHSKNLGQALIVAMAWSRLPKSAKAAVKQAWRQGALSQRFHNLDYEALLPRPLEDVRRELGIAAPTLYQAVTP
jgi:ubiquinone biosynthesis protein COQ4